MSYSFCFGPSGSGKSQRLREILIRKAQASLACGGNDRTKYILVVPEQYSMQTQRELVQDHPARVLMNIDVLSFGRLAYRVFEETGADRRTVLDDIGKSLLLRRVAAGCEKDLQVLHRGIRRTGMIDSCCSSNSPGTPLPQSLHTCCPLCLEHFPRYLCVILLHFI